MAMLTRSDGRPFPRRYANGRTTSLPAPPYTTTTAPRFRPNCTHMVMDRLRGKHLCDHCGQSSPLGWLYACAQDRYFGPGTVDARSLQETEGCSTEDELIILGVSDSMLRQVHAGMYSQDQLNSIKKQRQKVQLVITESLQKKSFETPMLPSSKATPLTPSLFSMAVPRRGERTPSGQGPASVTRFDALQTPCFFKCCHYCRSYLQERLFYSLNAVVHDDMITIEPEDIKSLPVSDADKLRQLGQHQPTYAQYTYSHPSTSPPSMTATPDATDLSSDSCDSSHDMSDEEEAHLRRLVTGSRPGLTGRLPGHNRELTWVNLVFGGAQLITSDCSETRDLYSGDSSRSSSAILQHNDASLVLSIQQASARPSKESLAAEIEVQGGVALTEEAVETQIPDVITDC